MPLPPLGHDTDVNVSLAPTQRIHVDIFTRTFGACLKQLKLITAFMRSVQAR